MSLNITECTCTGCQRRHPYSIEPCVVPAHDTFCGLHMISLGEMLCLPPANLYVGKCNWSATTVQQHAVFFFFLFYVHRTSKPPTTCSSLGGPLSAGSVPLPPRRVPPRCIAQWAQHSSCSSPPCTAAVSLLTRSAFPRRKMTARRNT